MHTFRYTWLGFSDRDKEGTFVWSDGKNSSFFYWDDDVESDGQMSENEDCAAMTNKGQWRTFHCENRFYFFCKKRICKFQFIPLFIHYYIDSWLIFSLSQQIGRIVNLVVTSLTQPVKNCKQ
jgi:hypothetical protein